MAKGKVSFNQERCKGCGLCVEACPVKIIQLDSNVINKGITQQLFLKWKNA